MANKQIHEKKKEGKIMVFPTTLWSNISLFLTIKLDKNLTKNAKIAKKPLIFNCQVLRQTDRHNHKNYLILK